MVLRLAGEFQGFARDLHDEATAFVRHEVAAFNPQVANMLQVLLTERRRLDSGNPHPGSLGADFGRFGIRLWHVLDAQDARNVARQRHLEHLNTARNGIAHGDAVQLNSLEQAGVRLDLATLRTWRRAADQLALQIDKVVADHLARLFNSAAPW